jgi:hypothetical protein
MGGMERPDGKEVSGGSGFQRLAYFQPGAASSPGVEVAGPARQPVCKAAEGQILPQKLGGGRTLVER